MKQRDLLGDDTPATPPKPKYTEAQQLTALYIKEFQKKFGEKPVVEVADGKILKDLIGQFGAEKVRTRLVEYLNWDDDYITNAGYPLRLFKREWNRLTSQILRRRIVDTSRSTPTTCMHQPPCRSAAEHTKRRLAELKG